MEDDSNPAPSENKPRVSALTRSSAATTCPEDEGLDDVLGSEGGDTVGVGCQEKAASENYVASLTAPILKQLALLKQQLDEVLDGQVKITATLSDRLGSKTLQLPAPERSRSIEMPHVIPEDYAVERKNYAAESKTSLQSFESISPLPTHQAHYSRQLSPVSPTVRRPRRLLHKSHSGLHKQASGAPTRQVSGAPSRQVSGAPTRQVSGAPSLICLANHDGFGETALSTPDPASPMPMAVKQGVRIARSSSSLTSKLAAACRPSNQSDEQIITKVLSFNSVGIEPTSPGCHEHSEDSGLPLQVKRSQSKFEAFRTEEEDKQDLMELFKLAEDWASSQVKPLMLSEQLRTLSKYDVELTVDSVIGVLIVLNALFIGVSMDAPASHQHIIVGIDVFFSIAFIFELCLKLAVNGFQKHFLSENRWMNTFDAALIFMDLVQLALQALYTDTASSVADLPSASIFRVVRLVRLVRILRLLRHPALQTLLMMLHGMVGGLPALGWALILFVSSVYIVALMLREFLGRTDHDRIYEYFHSVPRSMVTTFRCSFGDCETIAGTPIFEHVDSVYGFGFSVFYCLFAFVMSIGMFNVISAIFVQSTLTAASALKNKRKKERLQDDELWASRIYIIVRKLLDHAYPWDHRDSSLSDLVDTIYDLPVENQQLELLVADPDVKVALEDLDIDPEDNHTLADVLDTEQTGDVLVIELLQGLRRLRGNPRRSDIVAVDLTCRSMQNTLKNMQNQLTAITANQTKRNKH
eukprot:TRINITY_DN10770_c0_g5_i1.p1 TRINITY_DN10770_c0_g5~~TRINITY_DN10770_c0_g5_i1.p1  ORF type:complete len:753 (-),score=146.10 TRINITY_DN10770_c0_g5_i1:332-2590(-)